MTTPKDDLLASLLALRHLDDYPEGKCPAWMDSADRECAKPSKVGWLCTRHHGVALKRLDRERAALAGIRERERIKRAERIALLPKMREDLAKIEAEMNRLDPPPETTDRAAYGGYVHPSIMTRSLARLSDSKVQRMAALVEQHGHLSQMIKRTEEAAK